MLLLVVGTATLRPRADNTAEAQAQATRSSLQAQGYKLEVARFEFATTPEMRARAAILGKVASAIRSRERQWLAGMPSIHTNSTMLLWKSPEFRGGATQLRKALEPDQEQLDAACRAILNGRIGFEPEVRGNGDTILLPYVSTVSTLKNALTARLFVDLNNSQSQGAWTNLLALTRLATAWEPEPIHLSWHLRYSIAASAYDATWQALQSDHWTEEQLATLQREWESADFMTGLSENEALDAAAMLAAMRAVRMFTPVTGSVSFSEFLRSPREAFGRLIQIQEEKAYFEKGTYEDEVALMLYYRDRQIAVTKALSCASWQEMLPFAGVTNLQSFASDHLSHGGLSPMGVKQIGINFPLRGQTLLIHAAEAEARRRIVLAALALERFHKKHQAYPESLNQLVPEFLSHPPQDFMDGKPLRYRQENNSFQLWSVGIDCAEGGGGKVENGIGFPEAMRGFLFGLESQHVWVWSGGDIVWSTAYK